MEQNSPPSEFSGENISTLPEEYRFERKINEKYSIRCSCGVIEKADTENGIDIILKKQLDLYVNGKCSLSALVPANEYTDSEFFSFFADHIKRLESPEAFDQIRLEFCYHAPWNRTTPLRKIEIPFDEALLSLNDGANAKRFIDECRNWLVYDSAEKTWYAWNTTHWEPAETKLGKAKEFVAQSINEELEYWKRVLTREEMITDSVRRRPEYISQLKKFIPKLAHHYTQTNNEHGLNAMAKIAAANELSINFEEEGNADLLAFRNGVLDGKTGRFYPAAEAASLRSMYPRHYVDRTYTPGAKPEVFLRHLEAVFLDNTSGLDDDVCRAHQKELFAYFTSLLGYMLYPGNPRNLMVFFWGTGSNGKSTTISALRKALGREYAEASANELLVSYEEKPKSGIAKGLCARMLYFSEASDTDERRGPKISADIIKDLTGEDSTSRFRKLYDQSESHRVLCLPVASTNELPSFDKGVDAALLRRLITIPFQHEFLNAEINLRMGDLLHEEADAIFSFLLDKHREYLAREEEKPGSGLPPVPQFCSEMQERLLSGMYFYDFIRETYVRTSGEKKSERTTVKEMRQEFIAYAEEKGLCIDTRVVNGTDEYGNVVKKLDLTNTDAKKLAYAARAAGFASKKSGDVYYSCRKRNASDNEPGRY
ncbi:MAG TPA: hypothetical protein O0X42_01860 [Methanocorpusculum sp.]|nr:hypothetical protein [Methanocorpusculum sp.]